jgi:hypothetical protein
LGLLAIVVSGERTQEKARRSGASHVSEFVHVDATTSYLGRTPSSTPHPAARQSST